MAYQKANTPARNLWNIMSGRCLKLYHGGEGSGVAFTDLAPSRSLIGKNDAMWVGAPVWANGSEGNYANFKPTLASWATIAAADVTIPNGSLVLRFACNPSTTTVRSFFRVVQSGSSKFLDVRKLNAANTLRVILYNGSANVNLDFTGVAFDGTIHTLIVNWGAAGFTARLNGEGTVQTSAGTTNGVDFTSAGGMFLNALGVGSQMGEMEFYTLAMFDRRMPLAARREIWADPYVMTRPLLTSVLNTDLQCTLLAGTTTAKLVLNSAAALSGTVYVRARYGTDATMASVTNSSAVSTSSQNAKLTISLSGLTAGTEYFYQIEVSTDNFASAANRELLGFGLGRFKTRPTSGSATVAFGVFTDGHCTASSKGGPPGATLGYGNDIVFDDAGGVRADSGAGSKNFANYRTMLAMYLNDADLDFCIDGGDNFFFSDAAYTSGADLTQDVHPGHVDLATAAVRFMSLLHRNVGEVAVVDDNHDQQEAYQQQTADLKAKQKQGRIVKGRFMERDANGPAYTQSDWIAAADLADSVYMSTYVTDGGGENVPLGCRSSRWGCCEIFYLDHGLAADLGSHTSPAARTSFCWALGSRQFNWLAAALAASTATWKVVVVHHLIGGEAIPPSTGNPARPYGRGSGRRVGDANYYVNKLYNSINGVGETSDFGPEAEEEYRFHKLMRKYGVVAVLKMHDHVGAIVTKDSVNYVTCPTSGAGSHSSDDGWNNNTMDNSYGKSEGWGADVSGQFRYNGCGYVRIDASSSTFRLRMIATAFGTSGSGTANYTTPTHCERNVGAPGVDYAVNGSNQLTLPETPIAVHYIVPKSTGRAAGWYNSPPTDLANHAAYPYPWEEDYPSGVVTLTGAPGENVVASYAPMTVKDVNLTAADGVDMDQPAAASPVPMVAMARRFARKRKKAGVPWA